MDTSTAVALGALFTAVVTGLIAWRTYNRSAKKDALDTLETSYKKLQLTYEEDNTRLHNELDGERNARRADKLECQTLIDGLQRQLTTLLTKLPEPGAIQSVMIAGIDTVALPSLPVKLTAVQEDVILSTEIKRPIPLPMTAAQIIDAVAQATGEKKLE